MIRGQTTTVLITNAARAKAEIAMALKKILLKALASLCQPFSALA